MDARRRQWLLRQIVYTLTEFPDVENVGVQLNGESLPLGGHTASSFLTRPLFDVDTVLEWHDQTKCDGNTGADRPRQGPTAVAGGGR